MASTVPPKKRPDTAFSWLLNRSRATILLTAIICIGTLGTGLTGLPTLTILEDSICRRLVHADSQGAFNDKLCKGDNVQKKLSFVLGIQSMMEAIPGLRLFNQHRVILAGRV